VNWRNELRLEALSATGCWLDMELFLRSGPAGVNAGYLPSYGLERRCWRKPRRAAWDGDLIPVLVGRST